MADGGGAEMGGFTPDAANTRAFRDALGSFATGVTVVTVQGPSGPMGFTANSFASVSLDPPLVLWSVARASSRFAPFAEAEHFAIHVLAADQADLCRTFARAAGRFADDMPPRNAQGVPILNGALARFDCAVHARHEGGDHLILVGRVLNCHHAPAEPLVFSAGRMGRFVGDTPASDRPGRGQRE